MYACMYLSLSIYIYTHTRVRHVYIYIYIYIYLHTYTHTYTYLYLYMLDKWFPQLSTKGLVVKTWTEETRRCALCNVSYYIYCNMT